MLAKSFTVKLDRLIQELYFNIFNRTSNIKDLDFKIAFYIIQDIALIQHTTLLQLLSNQHAYKANYQAENQKAESQDALIRWAYTITNIIYFSRAKKRSNFFILLINIYLVGSKVKRRILKTLSSFRLYHNYYTANRIINNITKEVKVY